MNHKKQLLKNTFIIALGKISTQLISFLLLPMYTSYLSTSEYGIYDYIVTISIFIVPLVTLLMEEAMFRFIIDSNTESQKNTVIACTVQFFIKSIILFVILSLIINYFINYKYTMWLVFYVISILLLNLGNAILRGNGNIKFYSISNMIIGIVSIIMNVILIAACKFKIEGLFISTIVPNVIGSLFVLLKTKVIKTNLIKNYDKNVIKKMLNYSYPLVPSSISFSIVNVSDRILITNIIGASLNGIYSIATKFPTIINVIFGYFYIAWKETASRILKEENYNEQYNDIFNSMNKILISILLLLIAIMPLAFPILIKGNYQSAYYQIPILSFGAFYCCKSMLVGGVFIAFKDTKLIGKTTFCAALINFLINILFIKQIGLYAASLSTLCAYLFLYYYRKYKLKKYIRINTDFSLFKILMLFVCVIIYYYNNIIISIIYFAFLLIYCYYLNRDLIEGFFNKKKVI